MISLYKHNQTAYEAILASFKSGETACCIVHPTGTGKSYIVAKLVEDNPGSSFIIITPSDYIVGQFKQVITSAKVFYINYQTLINYLPEDIAKLKFDYIVLDEFHRAGSPIWGKQINLLFEYNPKAFKFGISATPIRHLDNRRDMGAELFNNNVVSSLSLNECFAKQILPSPKYVAALYSISEDAGNLVNKILASDHQQKQILADQLKNNIVAWERSGGIDAILKKYLSIIYKRIVVFTSSFKIMADVEKLLTPILDSIYPEIKYFRIHSDLEKKDNRQAFEAFSAKSTDTHVMFCVDMLNEGVHVEGVTAEILFRDTNSPTVYYQQIGRCLSAGPTDVQPLIIDLVNNFRKIKIKSFKHDYFTELKRGGLTTGRSNPKGEQKGVKFFDETRDLLQLFEIFASQVEKWTIKYNEAKLFYQLHGHLKIPKKHHLFSWIIEQRRVARDNSLPAEKIQLLDAIGFIWETDNGKPFEERLAELKLFIEKYQREPYKGDKDDVAGIANWLYQQRIRYKRGLLPHKYISQLQAVAPLLNSFEQSFEDGYSKLLEFFNENGHSDVPSSYSDKSLYNFVKSLRKNHKTGANPQYRADKLAALNFNYHVKISWEDNYKSYKKFIAANNRMNVSLAENKTLYLWITVQRRDYKVKKLPIEREILLKKIGFDFVPGKRSGHHDLLPLT